MRISDLERVQEILGTDIFVLDSTGKTVGIRALDLASSLFTQFGSDILSNLNIGALLNAMSVDTDDSLILGTKTGNKRLSVSNVFMLVPDGSGPHNSLYRGRNIQDKFLDGSLYDAIADGTFRDLFIGDYFDIEISTSFMANEKVRCMLAGFDIYWMCGDTPLKKHHAVIVPMNAFANTAKMNDNNTTVGAYADSKMVTNTLPVYQDALEAVFEDKMLQNRERFTNTISESAPSAAGGGLNGTVTNSVFINNKLRLMTEPEVIGCTVCSSSWWDVGICRMQLPLFRLNPAFIVCGLGGTEYVSVDSTRTNWWMSAVSSSANFALVSTYGSPGSDNASNARGVRPRWLIG